MKVLWKHRLDTNKVQGLDPSDVPNSGFRSVYEFGPEDAEHIVSNGYAGFREAVESHELFIDCDNDTAGSIVRRKLRDRNLKYSEYSTGGRGCHFHVNRVPQSGLDLPAIDKAFVEALSEGTADLSFYHHVGFYRCEGAVHAKTGGRKVLVERVEGKPLDLTKFSAPERKPAPQTKGLQSVFTDVALRSLTVPMDKGERHKRFCEIAAALHRLGQPEEFALGYMVNVNLMNKDPLPVEELTRMLRWAYYEKAY